MSAGAMDEALETHPTESRERAVWSRQDRTATTTASNRAAGLSAQAALVIAEAAEALSACRDADAMLKRAVELARERIGLERVAFYMRDARTGRAIFRGTWGTDLRGDTSDEHALFHELSAAEVDMLLGLRAAETFGIYRERAARHAPSSERSIALDDGWVMTTPIVLGGELLGVMYNDAALTEKAIDPALQASAAVLCSLVAVLYASRRGTIPWQQLPLGSSHSPLVERVVHAIHRDLPARGERLARELGVSPGHLARSFKREMGVSLVEYRNRLRIERFLEAVQSSSRSGNLLEAAMAAGFGSYAQFHRVYRKFVGTTPRRLLYESQPSPPALSPARTPAPRRDDPLSGVFERQPARQAG